MLWGHSRDALGLGGTPRALQERGADRARRRVEVEIEQPHTEGREKNTAK